MAMATIELNMVALELCPLEGGILVRLPESETLRIVSVANLGAELLRILSESGAIAQAPAQTAPTPERTAAPAGPGRPRKEIGALASAVVGHFGAGRTITNILLASEMPETFNKVTEAAHFTRRACEEGLLRNVGRGPDGNRFRWHDAPAEETPSDAAPAPRQSLAEEIENEALPVAEPEPMPGPDLAQEDAPPSTGEPDLPF